jgi:hypothetical protein
LDLELKQARPQMAVPAQAYCPHLGMRDDPETAVGYPSLGNHCYYAQPVAAINVAQQEQYCLSHNHPACPFLRANGANRARILPKELQARAAVTTAGYGRITLLLAAAILITLLLLGWRYYSHGATPPPLNSFALSATTPGTAVALINPGEPTATATSTATATATAVPPSATATATTAPTVTASPSSTPAPTATRKPPPTATPAPTRPALRALVAVPRLNLRGGPGADFPVIAVVESGTTFAITGRNPAGDWWQVCCVNGEAGWLYGESVTVEGDHDNVPIVLLIPTPTTTP